ncbi:MAG TPA: bifunctional diaminohydroxyphosphoribosylaminopyrimidine deaminase/5-amino-6-(5-phosphoribosylamino)uracil reductase RibD [Acidiferrobacter sp.]|nr:bifunctional diaminohydroxyphosphoribosylaminopyrimidine deaminase/5-amino-6-(5-phosphoribosylamino)uracil reductase RibD [Acidiferrobacter sp.]
MNALTDSVYMARALGLARCGMQTTHPNPRVGCVIVLGDRVVGEGFHERAGEPHAERLALQEAGALARGATAYVTLEPCCHVGRTPPCTEALLAAGIVRVVAAMEDPDPRVQGEGFAALRAAQVAVDVGLMRDEAHQLNRGFISRLTRNAPFVSAKVGASLDGRTALLNGDSQWITGVRARADVQALRAQSGAILTGMGTVRFDDPHLTVRHPAVRQPLRVVVDSGLALSPTARLVTEPGELVVFTVAEGPNAEALRAAGVRVVAVGGAAHAVDLRAVMAELAGLGINDLLVEAGPTLLASLLHDQLIDELILYMAPVLIGSGRPIADFTIPALDQQICWRYEEVRRVGHDLRITLTREI